MRDFFYNIHKQNIIKNVKRIQKKYFLFLKKKSPSLLNCTVREQVAHIEIKFRLAEVC